MSLPWFYPSQEPSPTEPLTHPHTSSIRGRTGRVKGRKLMGLNKDSLVGVAKAMHESRAKQRINSKGQADVQPVPGEQGPSCAAFLGQTNTVAKQDTVCVTAETATIH